MFAHTADESNPDTESGELPLIKPFEKKLRMTFLQMPEFTKKESECVTDLDKWAYIMNHMEKLTKIPWAAQQELYEELAKVSNVAALSPNERAIYEANLRQYRDNLAMLSAARLDGIAEGREEGREEGLKEGERTGRQDGERIGREKIARNMLAMGLSNEIIVKSTGLSVEDVHGLCIKQ